MLFIFCRLETPASKASAAFWARNAWIYTASRQPGCSSRNVGANHL